MAEENSTKVLIADDEESITRLLSSVFTRRGWLCSVVTDGDEALEQLRGQQFDAVVCDVRMPGTSAEDLLSHCRSRWPDMPFILVTGAASIEDAKGALRRGAYDYLEKPIDMAELCGVVERATSGRQMGGVETVRDGLTGLATPREFHERLTEVRLSSVAAQLNCSLVLVDVDQFAEANRMFGYAFGDQVLKTLASQLRRHCHGDAIISRLGGDEFAILLPDTDEAAAFEEAQNIRNLLEATTLCWQDHPISVTISLGVAETAVGFALSEGELMENARRALKEARRAGGDAVRAHSLMKNGSEGKVEVVAAELTDMIAETDKINEQLRVACLESVRALVSAVEAKDPYTRRHSEQVAYYAEQFATFIGLPGDQSEAIRVAGVVHDVGKIGIPDTVLTKPGRLTDVEFELIKGHPDTGAAILEKISLLSAQSVIIRHHHENWNGTGYPDGLAGEDIPLGARVVQVADSIDAMLMRRTYKEPFPVERVLAELQRGMGTQFDPDLAKAAIEWMTANPDRIILAEDQAAEPIELPTA